MPIEIVKRYDRAMIRANPDKFFVFGDNDRRTGLGGQAKEARGEPNAIGVRTKKAPGGGEADFYTDAEYDKNVAKIDDDITIICGKLLDRKTVVWPEDGVGTGLAGLSQNAPRTLGFIDKVFGDMVEVFGRTN